MAQGILSVIGRTPLVPLRKIFPEYPVRLYAKLEGLNPGGSSKDRPAANMIGRALESGRLRPGQVVIESSSGNMGIGLAQACRYHGLRFICVVDTKTTSQNLAILRAYGAEIELVTEPDPDSGELLCARLSRLNHLLDTIPGSFWPHQYANEDNAGAHHTTMREIVDDLGQAPDYLFCATSTCGTLRGCGEYARDQGLSTRVIAVDAVGSAIFGDEQSRRLIPGLGAAIVPELHRPDVVDRCVHVTDMECIIGCRKLVNREGILAGGSSGGVLMAARRSFDGMADNSLCVVVLPDRGERYLDTVYNDAWVQEHYGEQAVEDATIRER